MIQRKIALLGASGVGKTSLVRRFVESLFDEKYLTTIGVKVDKKAVQVGGLDVTLMLWDVAGAEERFAVPSTYVRGASGYLLVADCTRPETLTIALEIVTQMDRDLGVIPCVLALNKIDLADVSLVRSAEMDALEARARIVQPTSAKTGAGVEDAFLQLADTVAS